MTKQKPTTYGMGMPTATMLAMSILSALIVGASFVVIKSWPLPASVTPALGFNDGCAWGLVIGAISGLVLGFLCDDKHFPDQKQDHK